MMHKPLIALLAAAALLATQRTAYAVTAGDNGYLFLDLCRLITLPKRKLPTLPAATEGTANYKSILKLNASLSSEAWRANFAKEGATKTRPDYKHDGQNTDVIQQARWPHWNAAEDELEPADAMSQTLKEAAAKDLNDRERHHMHILLQPIAEEADAAYAELERLTRTTNGNSGTTADKLLKEAAFGAGVGSADGITDDNLKTSNGAATNRQALCGGGSKANGKAETIAAYMLCICVADAADNSGEFKACITDQDAAQNDASGLTNAAADLKNLIAKCPAGKEEEVSADEILQLVNDFRSKATAKPGALYYGTFSNNNCGGNSGSGLCVQYKLAAQADIAQVTDTPWSKKLRAAAGLIRQTKEKSQRTAQITERLQKLKAAAYNLRPQLELHKQQIALADKLTPEKQLNTGKQNQQQKEQCEAI
uniref:Variant surface glycoprotein 1361 n=1 Tax=Trypanosoma brucei TaxID=5691 RepID=M4SV90_9TRYP|nr:variant surface glycoprotein 1361 [Trypanosoma brucei]